MNRVSIAAVLSLMAAGAAAQSLPPANITTDPSTTPEVVQVLDRAGQWAPMGSIDPTTHTFTPVGGGGGGGTGLTPIPTDTVLGNASGASAIPVALTLPSCSLAANALIYVTGSGFGCNTIASGGGGGSATVPGVVYATDSDVGMVANTGVDNSPMVAAFNNKMGAFLGPSYSAYDAVIPGILGQLTTNYYFAEPFEASRAAKYRCSTEMGQVLLWFAAGVDGVIQDQGGSFSNCIIRNLGPGTGAANPLNNLLHNEAFYGGLGGVPQPVWHVGDGIFAVPFHNSAPIDAEMAYPPGTTVTAIHGGTFTGYIAGRALTVLSGDITVGAALTGGGVAPNTSVVGGTASPYTVSVTQTLGSAGAPVTMGAAQTLTLSNNANPYLAINVAQYSLPQIPGDPAPYPGNGTAPVKGTAIFTQTGSNNFNNLDTINIAGTIYTFTNITPIGGQRNVLIGPDFDTTANHLVSAVNNTVGQFVTYTPATGAVRDFNLPNQFASATHVSGSGVITLTSRYPGPAVSTFPSTYTTSGTAAGTFGAATFVGADDATSCPWPCFYLHSQIAWWQLPATEAFHVTTVAGSNRIGWAQPAAPHYQLYMGDEIWSDAFPFASSMGQFASAALFVETGTNNFNDGDQFQAGNNTWTFRTLPSVAADVAIGPDFQTSGKNLGAAMANTTLAFSGYIAGVNLNVPTPPATPLSVGGFITGAGVSAGTKIVSGSGTAFVVNNSQTVGSSGSLVAMQERNYVAPTVASNVAAVGTVGPTWITVYATGFSAPSSYHTSYVASGPSAGSFTTGSDFSQYTEDNLFTSNAPVNANATVTHPPSDNAPLWNLPTGLKRRATGTTRNDTFIYWPFGMMMNCGVGWGLNCDGSHDYGNVHGSDGIGRFANGDNYSSSASYDEIYNNNFIADDVETGTLGEPLYNPNFESTESGTSHYGLLMDCINQNVTSIYGGYIGGNNMCADPVKLIPGQPFGGPAAFGLTSGSVSGPNISGSQVCCNRPFTAFNAGNDLVGRVDIGGSFAASPNILSWIQSGIANDTMNLSYNATNLDYPWSQGTSVAAKFVNHLSADYSASGAYGFADPAGIILGGDPLPANAAMRLFGMAPSKPTGTWHKAGDTQINTATTIVPGSMGAWYSAGGSTSLQGVLSGTLLTVEQEVDPTPLPTLAAGGSGYASGANVNGTLTGNFTGCTTQPVLAVTANGTSGAITSVNAVNTKGVCTPAATFGATIAGTTMSTFSVNGTILIGSTLSGIGIIPGTTVVSGTGPTYQISNAHTIGTGITVQATTLLSGAAAPAWTTGGALAAGSGAFPNIVWEPALTLGAFSQPAGPPGLFQLLAGTGVIANTHIVSQGGTFGNYWTVDQTYASPIGPETITGDSWYPAMAISNDRTNPDFTAVTVRSGSSTNKDLTGRIALVGGAATFTLSGVYASPPDCVTADVTTPANANSVLESTTTLTFSGTGTDTLKWVCAGRN